MVALMHGDLSGSLNWNPFAVPLALLWLLSLGKLAILWFRGQRIRLSNAWLYAWLALLGVAWGIQTLRYLNGSFPVGPGP